MRNLSFKLWSLLILFAVMIISIMSFTTHTLLTKDVAEYQTSVRADIENNIVANLQTMDKAHQIFQKSETDEMKSVLYLLRDYYEENPAIHTWDLDAIKKTYEHFDFYILNNKGQVEITTHEPSRGIDFNDCCSDFVKLIQERIKTDQFYFDGLEISVAANDQRMYGYLPTKDHNYLLELGIAFEDTHVAKEFNYEKTVHSLLENHESLEDLRIFTYNGFVLNHQQDLLTYEDLEPKLQQAFLEASKLEKDTEVVKKYKDGVTETHRFISYQPEETNGTISKRIIYMKYNNKSELALAKQNSVQFLIMLVVAITTSSLLLLIILRILHNTIRLATYDSLTGAYNRASYLQHMDALINKRKHFPIGLMLVDLDNFKQVNDLYGHAEGDAILCEVAKILKEVTGPAGYVVRFGGDEFAIIIENAHVDKMKHYATLLLAEMQNRRIVSADHSWGHLSFSIGATIQQEPREEEKNLFERADQALYMSKERGKDGYTYLSPNSLDDSNVMQVDLGVMDN